MVHHVTDAELAPGASRHRQSIYGGGAIPARHFSFSLNFTQKKISIKGTFPSSWIASTTFLSRSGCIPPPTIIHGPRSHFFTAIALVPVLIVIRSDVMALTSIKTSGSIHQIRSENTALTWATADSDLILTWQSCSFCGPRTPTKDQ